MKQSNGFVPGKKISEYTKEEIAKIVSGSKSINKRPGFFDRMRIHYVQYEIDRDYLDYNKDDKVISNLYCYICSKRLSIGDYRDGHHPYHQEYNACKEHKNDYSNSINNNTDS